MSELFFELTPDRVLKSIEHGTGNQCTGYCTALNSYENRVYEVEFEGEGKPQLRRKVAKFYRPGRWSEDQILEEHQFLLELKGGEVPVVAPEAFSDGTTLKRCEYSGVWFALFPKVGGRSPDEFTDDQYRRIGTLLARIHNMGASRKAKHRLVLNAETYGASNLAFLLDGDWIPAELKGRYQAVVQEILELIRPVLSGTGGNRIHGDCHPGNLLWNEAGPFFLDFDDMVVGPEIQDLWLLLPGRDEVARAKLDVILGGYDVFRPLDRRQLRWIEALRALRFVHYSAWVARRWDDPAFPLAFPHFGTFRYWEERTADLQEQLERIRLDLLENHY